MPTAELTLSAGGPLTERSSATACCAHCSLPVPAGLVDERAEQQFCCAGCRTVFALLGDLGLERYYALAEGAERRPARVSGRSYAEFDDPTFQRLYCRGLPGGELQIELYLEGVHCTACVWLVEQLPQLAAGVLEARLELPRSMALVRFDPRATPLSRVAQAIDRLGYAAHPYRGVDLRAVRRKEDRRLLIRLAVAGAAAGNVMLMAFALYAGMFEAMERAHEELFRWGSLVISLPAVLYAGSLFFSGAWAALRARRLHMDLPIALGLSVGLASGVVNTLRGRGEIYFDTLTVLVFLLLVGRWVQRRQQRGAADAAEMLYSLTPTSARVLEGGSVHERPVETLVPGTLVELRAGDSVPADGVVREGRSEVNAAWLTGESRPVAVEPGEPIHAGTVNLSARLVLEVSAAGEATRVGRLVRHVADAARRRAEVVLLADRLAGVFVAVVLFLAALTFALWYGRHPEAAFEHAVALLIVTCPCALGMATPLAISAAIGRAAKAGILVKGGDALERLARPGRIYLDKTGTLTVGSTALVRWAGDETLQPHVAALEAQSAHRLARAFVVSVAPSHALAEPAVTEVRETFGAGIEGLVEGRALRVGSPAFVAPDGELPAWASRFVERAAAEAQTPVLVAEEGTVVAAASFGDPLRPEAKATVASLRALGFEVRLLSGDHPAVVEQVGRELGLAPAACEGGAAPERKLAVVEEALRAGPVVMVGDGVNDAAALAAATCGIAVHGGAEASLAAADLFIARPGLSAVVDAVTGARAALRVVRRNLLFALGYNVLGTTLAMTGVLNPLLAALMMPVSSLTVVTSSYRARTFEDRSCR